MHSDKSLSLVSAIYETDKGVRHQSFAQLWGFVSGFSSRISDMKDESSDYRSTLI